MSAEHDVKVRNVGIVGHAGVGKTILLEHILYKVGAISRVGSIAEGTTAGDYLDEEHKHKHTIALKVMNVDWKGVRIHMLDHPGYVDFLGEVAASTPLLDGLIVVVDATTGIQVGTDNAMKYADAFNVPRAIFLNKLDRENIDCDALIAQLQEVYGSKCAPLVIPNGTGDDLTQVANILKGAEGDLAAKAEELKEALTEVVAESDDVLADKYLDHLELSDEDFAEGFIKGIGNGAIIPIICGSVEKDLGLDELMDVIAEYFPSPLKRRIVGRNGTPDEIVVEPSVDGPFLGQVFRSVVDPFVGHLTLFRVLSGTLDADSDFYNVSTDSKERTGKIFTLCGKEQTQVKSVGPGDIAALTKLKHTHFGDTIGKAGTKIELRRITLPDSMVKLAINPKSRNDEDKIGEALNHIAEEDPTFKHYRDPETKEHVVRGLGELQLEILLERMHNKYHVEAKTSTPKVAFKETVKGKSDVQGKHKKQSGGHGQYGDVHLRISPNTRGEGYNFIDKIVGGVVPRQYIPHVDKGCHDALEKGVIAGFPVVDVNVELHFGSYHDVDSSEMAFKVAAAHAIQQGVREAKPCLLEPVTEIEVEVPDDFMGDVTGDLNSRRGRILGMEPSGPGKQTVRASVPEAEVLRYSTDLRSMTQGRGTYTIKFSHYDEVPDHVAKELIAAYEKAREHGE
jgi:elongation factor G